MQTVLEKAATAFAAGRYETGVRMAQSILDTHGENPDALLICGLCAQALGDTALALDSLRRAARVAGGRLDVLYNLALAEQRTGNLEQARSGYLQVLVADPGNVAASCNLADLCERTGAPEEAIGVLRRALQTHPEEPRLRHNLAGAMVACGRVREGVTEYRVLLERTPDDYRLMTNLAQALARLGEHEEAERFCRRASDLNPAYAPATRCLVRVLLLSGRAEAAVTACRGALARDPDDGEALKALGVALHRTGRAREAAEALERAIARAPEDAEAWYNLGAVYSDLEKNAFLEQAERAIARALELRPGYAEASACMGLIALKTGRAALAVRELERAVAAAPSRADFKLHLADALEASGRRAEALVLLERCVADHPGSSELARQLGVLRLRDGEPKQALAALERAFQGDPLDQRTVAHLAVALEELGRSEEARELKGLDRFVFPVRLQPPPPWRDIHEYNAELARDILAHPTLQYEPAGLAARGGSLTDNLLLAPTPAIECFEQLLRASIDALRAHLARDSGHPFLARIPEHYKLNSWACVVPAGGIIDTHIHEQSWLSGAYYVQLPEPVHAASEERPGWIEFGRPARELPTRGEPELRYYRPEEGLLIMFPSYLYHRTLPFAGGEQCRISIAFDLEVTA